MILIIYCFIKLLFSEDKATDIVAINHSWVLRKAFDTVDIWDKIIFQDKTTCHSEQLPMCIFVCILHIA